MFKTVFFVILLVLTFANSFSQTLIKSNASLIKYSGRIDTITSENPTFSYSGVRIRANFEGTSLKVKMNNLSEQNYFFVIIDKRYTQKLKVTKGLIDYTVASELDDTVHLVEIIKLTECQVGKCEFHGFILDEGKTLAEIHDDNGRIIEFIGNSITCGYGIEVLDKDLHFDPATENFYDTYACITARAFNADYKAICRSGIGIYRNYDGPTSGSTDNMLTIYDQIFYNQDIPKWNFQTDPADVVTINLGTNDFSTSGADSSLFVNNYDSLLSQIRFNYPLAKIILLLGPMNNDKVLKSYLTFLVQKHKNKGDENIHFLEMSNQWDSDYGIGADWHPSRRQSRENASELIHFINTITNWSADAIIKDIEIVDTAKIRLSFSKLLDVTYSSAEFKVLLTNGTELPILSIKIDPDNTKIVYLDLDYSLKIGDEINVSYLDTTLQNMEGNKVQYFYNQPAVNALKEPATQYQLSLNVNGSGTATGAGTYDENKVVLIEAIPDAGWLFTNWSGETTSTSASVNIIMNSDKSLTANFEETTGLLNSIKSDEQTLLNYPNPFKNTTTIKYHIPKQFNVKLRVLDVNGKELSVLVDSLLEEGNYMSIWDGSKFSDGVYFYQLEYNERVTTKKMTLSK